MKNNLNLNRVLIAILPILVIIWWVYFVFGGNISPFGFLLLFIIWNVLTILYFKKNDIKKEKVLFVLALFFGITIWIGMAVGLLIFIGFVVR